MAQEVRRFLQNCIVCQSIMMLLAMWELDEGSNKFSGYVRKFCKILLTFRNGVNNFVL